MINFTASIKPKGLTRYNDANITASLRQLLSTLRTSCNELDGKIDAKIKSLFNTAISSVSNAVSSNGTRGVGKAVADVKKLLSVTIPSKIKQAITKALDAVIKFFEWLESSAPDSERKKYSKEANEVFKQWKYKRKAIKAGKQTGEGPEITVINPHDDPTGAKARELSSKRAKIKSRKVPEEERKFAERVRSPQYSAERRAKLNSQIEKDKKKIEKEARKNKKEGKALESEQSSQLKYINEYMKKHDFSRELKFKVYKEYTKNVYKFAGKPSVDVMDILLESVKTDKTSLKSLLSGIKSKGIKKVQSRIARKSSRSISLARKRKSLKEMRRKLASWHKVIQTAKQIVLQFKKIPPTYVELANELKEAQQLIVSSEEEIKDTENLIVAAEEAVIDAEKVEEVAKDAAIEADKAEETAQKESESPTTTQAKVEKKEEEAEKKLEVAEKKEEEAQKISEAAEKKVDIAEKKVDAIEKKVATVEKKAEALSELADKTLKVTPVANAEKTANVAKAIAPISSAAKEVNEADKKINKAVEANNIVTLRESLMDYMNNHGLKSRKGVVSGRFTQLVNNGKIKGTESLQDVISLLKLDNPDVAKQGRVTKTTSTGTKTTASKSNKAKQSSKQNSVAKNVSKPSNEATRTSSSIQNSKAAVDISKDIQEIQSAPNGKSKSSSKIAKVSNLINESNKEISETKVILNKLLEDKGKPANISPKTIQAIRKTMPILKSVVRLRQRAKEQVEKISNEIEKLKSAIQLKANEYRKTLAEYQPKLKNFNNNKNKLSKDKYEDIVLELTDYEVNLSSIKNEINSMNQSIENKTNMISNTSVTLAKEIKRLKITRSVIGAGGFKTESDVTKREKRIIKGASSGKENLKFKKLSRKEAVDNIANNPDRRMINNIIKKVNKITVFDNDMLQDIAKTAVEAEKVTDETQKAFSDVIASINKLSNEIKNARKTNSSVKVDLNNPEIDKHLKAIAALGIQDTNALKKETNSLAKGIRILKQTYGSRGIGFQPNLAEDVKYEKSRFNQRLKIAFSVLANAISTAKRRINIIKLGIREKDIIDPNAYYATAERFNMLPDKLKKEVSAAYNNLSIEDKIDFSKFVRPAGVSKEYWFGKGDKKGLIEIQKGIIPNEKPKGMSKTDWNALLLIQDGTIPIRRPSFITSNYWNDIVEKLHTLNPEIEKHVTEEINKLKDKLKEERFAQKFRNNAIDVELKDGITESVKQIKVILNTILNIKYDIKHYVKGMQEIHELGEDKFMMMSGKSGF